MIEFEKPNIECLDIDDANNYAKFVCEPLERGYGVTIGNSLRRILLSSLPGCALTSVKIDGVLHEFSTIPNVVEDVPELIVNLKSVRLKFDGNEEIDRIVLSVQADSDCLLMHQRGFYALSSKGQFYLTGSLLLVYPFVNSNSLKLFPHFHIRKMMHQIIVHMIGSET